MLQKQMIFTAVSMLWFWTACVLLEKCACVCGYLLDAHIHHTQSIQDFNWMSAIITISTGQRTNSSMCWWVCADGHVTVCFLTRGIFMSHYTTSQHDPSNHTVNQLGRLVTLQFNIKKSWILVIIYFLVCLTLKRLLYSHMTLKSELYCCVRNTYKCFYLLELPYLVTTDFHLSMFMCSIFSEAPINLHCVICQYILCS